jgi:hypothetical protein
MRTFGVASVLSLRELLKVIFPTKRPVLFSVEIWEWITLIVSRDVHEYVPAKTNYEVPSC